MSGAFLGFLMTLFGIMLAFTQVLLKRFLGLYATLEGDFLDKAVLSLRSYLPWAVIAGTIMSVGL